MHRERSPPQSFHQWCDFLTNHSSESRKPRSGFPRTGSYRTGFGRSRKPPVPCRQSKTAVVVNRHRRVSLRSSSSPLPPPSPCCFTFWFNRSSVFVYNREEETRDLRICKHGTATLKLAHDRHSRSLWRRDGHRSSEIKIKSTTAD